MFIFFYLSPRTIECFKTNRRKLQYSSEREKYVFVMQITHFVQNRVILKVYRYILLLTDVT